MLLLYCIVFYCIVILFHERGNPFSQDWYKWGTLEPVDEEWFPPLRSSSTVVVQCCDLYAEVSTILIFSFQLVPLMRCLELVIIHERTTVPLFMTKGSFGYSTL